MTRPDPPSEQLLLRLHDLHVTNRESWRRLSPDHSVPTLMALSALRRTQPSRVRDLAHELRIDVSVASRQVSALQEEGLVARAPDPEDGRSQLLSLTDAGTDVLDEAHGAMRDRFARALSDWEGDELDGLVTGLERLHEALLAEDHTNLQGAAAR